MTKPATPEFPGMGAMTDTLEFVKKLWGGMGVPGTGMPGMSGIPGMSGMSGIPGIPGIPGMVMPTLSVEEINKQIADLRAVEAWLNLNMNMLRGTIQALEVQSATITTLQNLGQAFGAAASGQAGSTAAPPWQSMSPGMSAGRTNDSATAAADANRANGGNHANGANGKNGANGANGAAAKPESNGQSAAPSGDATAYTAPMANAAVWWNMLQDQFKQAVGNAMQQEATKPANKKAADNSSAKAPEKGDDAATGKPAAPRKSRAKPVK